MMLFCTEHQIDGESILKATKEDTQNVVNEEATALKLQDSQLKAKVGLPCIF